MQDTSDLREWRKGVRIYHAFPSLIAVVVVVVFLVSFFLAGSYLVAGIAAGIPALLLLWRWSVAGKLIDSYGCPRCGRSLKGKLTWVYPPAKCPHCGRAII
jgi:predicted RNA-binding Zn-ribbon protein involved in translation (DUF1610 family)